MRPIIGLLNAFIALLEEVLYDLGSSNFYLKPISIAFLPHGLLLPLLHVLSHPFTLGFTINNFLLLLLLLQSLTLNRILLLLILALLIQLGLPIHILQNLMSLLLQLLLPLGLHILVVTLHLVFVLFNLLKVVLVHMMLVGLRLVVARTALDNQLVLGVVATVIAHLFLDVSLRVLVDLLVLSDELRGLLLGSSQLDLVDLSHHTLDCLVDAEGLLWLYRWRLLDLALCLLSLHNEVLKLLLSFVRCLLWRPYLLLLLFN